MALEIERKWLPKEGVRIPLPELDYKTIAQSYIINRLSLTVRLRRSTSWRDNLRPTKYILTIKTAPYHGGLVRKEYEWDLPAWLPNCVLNLFFKSKSVISKERYIVEHEGFKFEVDKFLSHDLTLIELELDDIHQEYPKPEWLGEEVTGLSDYTNAAISNGTSKVQRTKGGYGIGI